MELGQLTERERNVYSFVVEWIRSNLSFPNAKEIAGGVGLPPDTARRILRSLGDKSFIDVSYASPATASRLKLIKRGEFRKVGERRLVLEVDLNSGYWFARHQLARAATQYAGCWKSHKAAVNGLTKMGFRPIFPRNQYGFRTDKNGNHILTTKQIVLLLALYQQQNARVASKDLWYEKCQDLLSRLGWQTTNRHLRGAAERLPGGLISYSAAGSGIACSLTSHGIAAIKDLQSDQTDFIIEEYKDLRDSEMEQLRLTIRKLASAG